MNIYKVSVSCLVIICIIILICFILLRLPIKTIYIISHTDRIKGLELFENKNIFLIEEKEIKRTLMEKNLFIADVIVTKQYPQTIRMNISKRTAIAQIAHSSSVFLDSYAVLFSDGAKEGVDLPIVETDEISVGASLQPDWRLVSVTEYIKNLSFIELKIKRIIIDNNNKIYHMYLANNEEIFIPFSSERVSIATSLQIITTRFRIEGKLIRKIDFRFDKPVVVLTNEEKN